MIVLFCLCFLSLFGNVKLTPNPQQYFNGTENFANRVVYFFVQKNGDGSITLQIEPPPFQDGYLKFLDEGIAYIDCDKVVKNYTAAEVATLGDVDISFTVKAYANKKSTAGFNLYNVAYQWSFFLDPRSTHYYQLQQFNNAAGTNPTFGGQVFYSDMLGMKHWVSNTDGVFLTASGVDNVLLKQETAATDGTITMTIRINFAQFVSQVSTINNNATAVPPAGIYSMFFFFEMTSLNLSEALIDTMNNYLLLQQTQLNYLYNNILWIDGFLDGNSTLYDPNLADQVIIKVNRQDLIDQYNTMLAIVTAQWDGFAALSNLTPAQAAVITSMQTYLVTAQSNTANFKNPLA